jgi:conjugative transposon TraM protein
METHSQKFLQQRRFYMMLPVLIVPFLSMIFWALGGGQGTSLQAKEISSGLNLELPGAHFNKNNDYWNKLTLYENAKRDSIRYEQARKSDPYYELARLKSQSDTTPKNHSKLNASLGSKHESNQLQQQEQLINQKLQQLTRQLNQSEVVGSDKPVSSGNTPVARDSTITEDIARLEKMMSIMAASDSGDPELQQVDGMLDKILAIQHPDRVTQELQEENQASDDQALPMIIAKPNDNITTLHGEDIAYHPAIPYDSVHDFESLTPLYISSNAFFGLDGEDPDEYTNSTAVNAVIHDTQTVTSGATIKMRLLTDVYIGDRLVPKDQFIYGVCAISGERLMITIRAIRLKDVLLPTALQVYDLDGQEGIYIPDAMTVDAAKQASSQSIQSMQLYSLDNSVAGQAATAGLEAAKGLFSKKMKVVKVTVKAGYQLLLKDAGTYSHKS